MNNQCIINDDILAIGKWLYDSSLYRLYSFYSLGVYILTLLTHSLRISQNVA